MQIKKLRQTGSRWRKASSRPCPCSLSWQFRVDSGSSWCCLAPSSRAKGRLEPQTPNPKYEGLRVRDREPAKHAGRSQEASSQPRSALRRPPSPSALSRPCAPARDPLRGSARGAGPARGRAREAAGRGAGRQSSVPGLEDSGVGVSDRWSAATLRGRTGRGRRSSEVDSSPH